MLALTAMHVCYIVTFARVGRAWPRAAPVVVAAYLAAMAGALAVLVPHAGTFGVPLVAYSASLTPSAAQTLVLATYYAAQVLIVAGVLRMRATAS